jgi:hypothetical protein
VRWRRRRVNRDSKRPLYVRLLHLQHIAPNAWQRALFGEGSFALAAVLVLADLATAWTLLALPVVVALLVKAHDLLAGLLRRPEVEPERRDPVAMSDP